MDAVSEDAVIIGAGPAGLACARNLTRRGVPVLLVEQGPRPGEAWRQRHRDLRLTTPRRLSDLPGYRLASHYGRWPRASDWADYLERYAERMSLRVRTNWPARSVERGEHSWIVRSDDAAVSAKNVVVATGEDRIPVMPSIGSVERFTGQFIHAADFESVARHNGERVLVVGAGTSGTELATWLARDRSIEVLLSARSSPVLLPRQFAGVPMSLLGLVADRAPDTVLDAIGYGVQRVAFGGLHQVRHNRHRLSERRHRRYAPAIDDGFAATVRCGDVRVVPALTQLEARTAVFADGERISVDTVIAATGYRPALEDLVGELGVLTRDGRPLNAAELRIRAPGLHFIGLRPRVGPLLPAGRREGERLAIEIEGTLGMSA